MSIYAKAVRVILVLSIIFLIAMYLLLGLYYSDGFGYGTWINNNYCTGMSVSEVNDILINQNDYQGINVTDKYGEAVTISTSDVDYQYDYTKSLTEYMNKQNFLLWGANLFTSKRLVLEPEVTYDEDKLYTIIDDWDIFDEQPESNVYIKMGDEGYELVNDKKDKPIIENVIAVVNTSLAYKNDNLVLPDECYEDADFTTAEQNIISTYDKIQVIQGFEQIFQIQDIGIALTKKDIDNWIVTDKDMKEFFNEELSEVKSKATGNTYSVPYKGKYIIGREECEFPEEIQVVNGIVMDNDGNIILSEYKMQQYVESLAETYDNEWSVNAYINGDNNTILLTSAKDGKIIDTQTELQSLISKFINKDSGYHDLALVNGATYYDGNEKLGETFIVVNMKQQQLTYYVNKAVKHTYPIVTGNTSLGRSTPTGIYNIYNKRYHTVLRGENYASYVNYWLGIHKGIGIHDATWRDEFGGTIYKTAGSHGCINSPLEDMEKLYEEVEVGTPTILFY